MFRNFMSHYEVCPCNSLKSTVVNYGQTKLKHGYQRSNLSLQSQSWFFMAKINSITVVQSDLWFAIVFGICRRNQICDTFMIFHSIFINDYVSLWFLSRVMSHYNVHQVLCLIVELFKSYATLR